MVDEVFRSEIAFEDDKIYHKTTQPSEDLILNRNKELRKDPSVIKDLGQDLPGGTWGRSVASIPFVLYEKAIRDGYALNAKDSEIRSKELFRWLQTEEGKTCLINPNEVRK